MCEHRTSISSSSPFTFPRAAGADLPLHEQIEDQLSLTQTSFCVPDSPMSYPSNDCESEPLFERSNITRQLVYGAPREKKDTDTPKHSSRNHRSRRRTQYYKDTLSYKDQPSFVREGIFKDSPIVAELRTNVIMEDEYPLIMNLSQTIARRYQRPNSSVMVTLEHSACLLLGANFDSTYILSITALPVHIQPTTNKRNAALLQSSLADALGVPPHRGIVKFQSIAEENIATNGTTVLGEIERLEKQFADEHTSTLKRTMTKASRKSLVLKSTSSVTNMGSSPPCSGHSPSYASVLGPIPVEIGDCDEPTDTLSESKNLSEFSPVDLQWSGHSSKSKIPSPTGGPTSSKRDRTGGTMVDGTPAESTTTSPSVPMPPPIPEETPTQKIGKRKSFIAIFKW